MIRTFACIAALSLTLSAHAETSPEPSDAAIDAPTTSSVPLRGAGCLRAHRISGYNVVDNRHILVTAATRSRTYLVATQNNCRDLRFGDAIAIRTRGLDCVDRFSKIIPLDQPGFNVPCYVDTVDRVENREAAKALIKARADAAEAAEDTAG